MGPAHLLCLGNRVIVSKVTLCDRGVHHDQRRSRRCDYSSAWHVFQARWGMRRYSLAISIRQPATDFNHARSPASDVAFDMRL